MKSYIAPAVAGLGAGALNGLFGAGGGMVLVPLMSAISHTDENTLFPNAILILLPICTVSLLFADGWEGFSFLQALPYLLGSGIGGICAGIFGKYIPTRLLHRILGVLIIWGGIRFLC